MASFERNWMSHGMLSRFKTLIAPPHPVFHNPNEKNIESQYPLGRWNLYIGGAGNVVSGYINIDILPASGVDVVCTAEHLPFKDRFFTRIECDAVLEHTEKPELVIREIKRTLKSDCLVHLVVPFCHPFHEYPKDYRRYTPDGLRLLVEDHGLEMIDRGWRSGPTATLLVFTLEYFKCWSPKKWYRNIIHLVFGWLLFLFRYLDFFLFRIGDLDRIGNHHYLYARRAE